MVDLHIHSIYSDGTYDVNEILEHARKNGVKILSIADHNVIEAYQHLNDIDDLIIIKGVEIDAHGYDLNVHILGYQCDYKNKEFVDFVNHINKMLEEFDDGLLWKLNKDYPMITKEDYDSYVNDPKLGGWKSLNYLIHKNIIHDLKDYFNLYSKYDHSNHEVNYPSIKEVVNQIHKANGYSVLAHPGKVIKYKTLDEFESMLRKMIIENKIDGIECYYPSHTKEITERCLRVCEDYDLIITCGCDCHGTFQKTNIGEMKKTLKDLKIDKLLKKESD